MLVLFTLLSCAHMKPQAPEPCAPSLRGAERFARYDLEGVFVLRDESTGCSQATDAELADTPFRPQSTFKIPNTLIGLETGAITGEHHLWRWDGVPRRLPSWDRDLELGAALKVSCVPCYQDVARRVGEDAMRAWMREFRYGNQDISGPIDAFWLDGPLRITPREQTEFLHRLLAGELPIRAENVEILFRLLELDSGPDWRLSGKTGLGTQDGRAIGWLVGLVERGGHRFTFATFVRSREGSDLSTETTRLIPIRAELTRALLVENGVLVE